MYLEEAETGEIVLHIIYLIRSSLADILGLLPRQRPPTVDHSWHILEISRYRYRLNILVEVAVIRMPRMGGMPRSIFRQWRMSHHARLACPLAAGLGTKVVQEGIHGIGYIIYIYLDTVERWLLWGWTN